nr:IS3 family transposase [Vagococcus lutrae]
MGTRVSYPLEVKQATIKMKLEGKSTVIQIVIDYIKYYNKTESKQKLGYKSPIEY